MFNIIQFIVPVMFLLVIGIIIFSVIKGIGQWTNNNSNTFYHITFEVESGDRMELQISGREYGLLAEGDVGKLTFQGTRYKNFEREF